MAWEATLDEFSCKVSIRIASGKLPHYSQLQKFLIDMMLTHNGEVSNEGNLALHTKNKKTPTILGFMMGQTCTRCTCMAPTLSRMRLTHHSKNLYSLPTHFQLTSNESFLFVCVVLLWLALAMQQCACVVFYADFVCLHNTHTRTPEITQLISGSQYVINMLSTGRDQSLPINNWHGKI